MLGSGKDGPRDEHSSTRMIATRLAGAEVIRDMVSADCKSRAMAAKTS